MFYLPLLRHLAGKRDRPGEQRQLRRWMRTHQKEVLRLSPGQLGNLAAVLGPTSHGILGTEPVYTQVQDLSADVGTLVHRGYQDLGFFSLEGFLWGQRGEPPDSSYEPTRPDWQAWLEASLGDGARPD